MVRDYVKELSSLMLEIRSNSEEDKLFIAGVGTSRVEKARCVGLSGSDGSIDGLVDYKLTRLVPTN